MRLFKAPAALVVVAALLVLPSLYTWYNVVAFWDPYEATGNLRVCVVNEDEGAENELIGKLNVGERLEEEVLKNDKLDFVVEEHDQAMQDLASGAVYAVYVVPSDFTECLISPVTGTVKSPRIAYYPNEKLGPVSPKITDAGATTLRETINSMFVAALSEAAVGAIDGALDTAQEKAESARSKAGARLDTVLASIGHVRKDLADIKAATDSAQDKTKAARTDLDGATKLVDDAKKVLADVSDESEAVQESLKKVTSTTVDSVSGVLSQVSKITGDASTAADGFRADAGEAKTRVDMALSRAQPVIDELNGISADLSGIADALPDDWSVKGKIADEAQEISARAERAQSFVNEASDLSQRVVDASEAALDAANSLEGSAAQAKAALQDASDKLVGDLMPAVIEGLQGVSAASGRMSAAVSGMDATIQEAGVALDQLDGVLGNCGAAVEKSDGLVGSLEDDLTSAVADVRLLANSKLVADLVKDGSLSPQKISEFMKSPTKLETVEFYRPNAYGTAMAPLFMNLTFWIGAFMLMIIFRLEVDDEGIKKITVGQRFLARYILFAILAASQGIICCAGVLALGVQAANVPALFAAAALASLAFLSVIYTMSTTLQHIGKALCIILVFAQIPGGSGLYPLELTSSFFQTIYPFLPFSYGIGAMREAIGGFYGNAYAFNMAVLLAIMVGMLVLGRVVVPLMSNVTNMVSRQVREGDLYNGEDAETPVRPYRIAQVMNALADREEYRADLERRYAWFNRIYPVFIRASIVLGLVVPAVMAVMLALDAAEKVVLLTVILLWLVALIVFLVIVESLRYSFERQMGLEGMSGDSMVKVFFDRNRMARAGRWSRNAEDAAEQADAKAGGDVERNAAGEAREEAAEEADGKAGESAGETVGESSVEASGETTGEASGESAGEASGEATGERVDVSAGEASDE